ncbi:MAG: DnaJ domain-containing protein [bacterium]|nr:DnaJ domain-containing protein [bacterium]
MPFADSSSIQSQVFVDHYRILGLDTTVDTDLVKKAFRRLAKQHHPDYAGGDGLRFLEIYTAYRVLADPERRLLYDRQHRDYRLQQAAGETARRRQGPPRREIPATRFKFPGDIKSLAKRGLLRRKFRSRDRRFILNIDYDLELLLSPQELASRLRVAVPVIARALCPDCRGSNPQCFACNGRGSYKSSRIIHLDLDGGLSNGQIIELNLRGMRPGPLSHFKRRTLRLKISEVVRAAG